MTVEVMKERQLTKTRQWEQALNLLYIDFWDYCHDALSKFDDEDIHQARVNCRKLLTLLSILDPGHTLGLYPLFEKAQKRLGKVRDADVLIESFKTKRKHAKENGDTKTAELLKAVIDHQKDKRKTYRKKLADELPKLINEDLDEKWKAFLSEQLEALVAKKDANVVMRELEVAYEQKKKACKVIFRGQDVESEAAFDALHELRMAAKELRYTASAASFALNQKFHAHEEIYKQIQDQLGLINDKRLWLETLNTIGREELDIGKKTWNTFTEQLKTEVLDALHQNDVIPVTHHMK
jgi:CHAD domain-containing protein